MLVEVYWNLHRDCFSVRACEGERKGKVIAYAHEGYLRNARFVVRDAARRKVREGAPKSVHAWIRGEACELPNIPGHMTQVTYNPHRDESFIRCDTRAPVHSAPIVRFSMIGNKPVVLAKLEN